MAACHSVVLPLIRIFGRNPEPFWETVQMIGVARERIMDKMGQVMQFAVSIHRSIGEEYRSSRKEKVRQTKCD